MLILLAIPVIVAVAFVHRLTQTVAPSNMLVRRVRTAAPAFHTVLALLALAVVLLALAHGLAEAVAGGATGWLNLIVFILAWDAIKLAILACLTGGRRAIRLARRRGTSPDGPVPSASPQDSAGRRAARTHVRETSAHASR